MLVVRFFFLIVISHQPRKKAERQFKNNLFFFLTFTKEGDAINEKFIEKKSNVFCKTLEKRSVHV